MSTDWAEIGRSAKRAHNAGIVCMAVAPLFFLLGLILLIFTSRNGIGWGTLAAGPVTFLVGIFVFAMHK